MEGHGKVARGTHRLAVQILVLDLISCVTSTNYVNSTSQGLYCYSVKKSIITIPNS